MGELRRSAISFVRRFSGFAGELRAPEARDDVRDMALSFYDCVPSSIEAILSYRAQGRDGSARRVSLGRQSIVEG